MRCMECGGVLIETVKTIKTTVKSGSFCVEGIPHYKCESCGSIEFGTGVMEKMTAVVEEAYKERNVTILPIEEGGLCW